MPQPPCSLSQAILILCKSQFKHTGFLHLPASKNSPRAAIWNLPVARYRTSVHSRVRVLVHLPGLILALVEYWIDEYLLSSRVLTSIQILDTRKYFRILMSNFNDTHEYYPSVQVRRPQIHDICCIYDRFRPLMTLL
jgi:hypothetical protein